jgi:hypothetical protein
MPAKRFVAAFTATMFIIAAFATVAQAACVGDTWTGGGGNDYWGTAANWSTDAVPSGNDVCINTGDVIFVPYVYGGQTIYQDTVGSVTIGSGATLEVEGANSNYGSDYYTQSDLATNSISVQSGGELLLDSTANSAPSPADSSVPSGASPGGTANVYVGASGTNGTLTNSGTIIAETSDALYGELLQGSIQNAGSLTDASGDLTLQDDDGVASANTGTITIASGASTALTSGPGFTNSGSIVANGSLSMASSETWTQSGGSVTGSTVTLASGDTLADSAGPASFQFLGGNYSSAISGTIPAGQTIGLASSPSAGNAIVDLDGTVTNDGTFTMDAEIGSTGNPEIDEGGAGGTFVNNGTLNTADPIATQSNLFRANLTNAASGVVNVESGFTHIDSGTTTTNAGKINVAAGAELEFSSGSPMTNSGVISDPGSIGFYGNATWAQTGGAQTGTPIDINGTLADSGGTGGFIFDASNGTLSGTIPAGQTVTLASSAAQGNTLIASSGSITNDGTFVMDTPTNSTGNPEIDSGAAGDAFLNHGVIEIEGSSSSYNSLFRIPLTNAPGSSFDVQSGKVYFDAGNTTTNDGSIVIAPGAQYNQQNGALIDAGTLDPQIASATRFGVYSLNGGTFAAGGELSPSLTGGYQPAKGKEFPVLLVGGTFSDKFAGAGNGFSVDYSHETKTPAYIGAVYGGAASAGKPVKVGKVSAVGGKLVVKLACSKGARCASYSITATVTEHFRGKKLTAVTARASAAQAATVRVTTKVVTIASAKGSLSADKTVTRTLSLNKLGAALLKRHGKLKTLVRVNVGKRVVSTHTVTLTERKAE